MKKLKQLGQNYWLLWASQVVNAFGDGFYTIGVSWLVYARTGSTVILGGLWATYMLVLAVGQTVIAPLVDWQDRRRLMIWIDSLRGVLVVAPFVLSRLQLLEIWHIYVIFIAMGLMGLPYGSANRALVQRVTPRRLLLRANSWLQGGVETMYLMGPATAGLVIFYLGAETALVVDALTFWLTAGLIGLIRFRTPVASYERVSGETTERRSYPSALLTGVETLRQSRLLLLLTGLLASVAFSNMAFTTLVVPYVIDHLHATSIGVGLMEGSMSVGFIVVSLLAERVMTESVGRRLLWILPLAIPLVACGLSFNSWLMGAMVLQVAAGLGWGLFDIQRETIFQQRVDNSILGRTLMLRNSLTKVMRALGAVLAGWIAARLQVQTAFFVLGAVGFLLSLGLLIAFHGGSLNEDAARFIDGV